MAALLSGPRAATRRTPLSWRVRDWIETVEFSDRTRRLAAIAALVALGAVWGAMVGVLGMMALLLCVSIFAVILCVRDFRFGVALLIAIMPISQSKMFPREMFGVTGMNPLNLLMAATLGALFMRSLGDGTWKHFLPRSIAVLYILPLTMGAALGVFHVEEIPKAFYDYDLIYFTNAFGYVRDMWGKPLTFVCYALLVAAAVERSEHSERFITPMVISVLVMALLAVGFVLVSGVSISALSGVYARHFFSDLGMHANDLGRLYATAYALLLFVWDRTEGNGKKSLLLGAMFLTFVALVLTFSRGAFLGFVLVNIIYLLSRLQARTFILAVLLLPIALWLAPGALWDRLTMGMDQGANAVSAGRTNEIWAPLIPELFKSPFWGNGLGSILWSDAMLEGRLYLVSHPHNAYLQAYMDMGVIGLVALSLFWFYCWRHFRRLAKDERLKPTLRGFFEGAAAGLVAFLVAGFAGSSLAPAPEQAFIWLAVGVMFGVRFRFARLARQQKQGA